MGLAGLLAPLGSKLVGVVDDLVQDKDLKEKLRAQIQSEVIDADAQVAAAAAKVVTAEAKGENWLQRNWRPLMMIWFAFLIGAYWFGYVPVNLPETVINSLFTLVQIGIGGYVVGRSGEKIARSVAPSFQRREHPTAPPS